MALEPGANTASRTVVVLGLARSGTSVITGLVKKLGVDMGPSVHDNSNPRGSNEDVDFAKLHKDIFDLAGEGKEYWSPPSPQEILELSPRFDPIIGALIKQKSEGKTHWGWKHPRTLLTYELFLPHLVNPHFILVFRNFLGIAESSVEHTRRRRHPLDFSQALKLVHFYHGEMMRFLEDHPNIPKHFVSYEDVLVDPVAETKKIASFLGIALTDDAVREVTNIVIPRARLPLEKKKMQTFFRGKLPRLIRKWSQD